MSGSQPSRCTACAAVVSADSTECPTCGSPLSREASPPATESGLELDLDAVRRTGAGNPDPLDLPLPVFRPGPAPGPRQAPTPGFGPTPTPGFGPPPAGRSPLPPLPQAPFQGSFGDYAKATTPKDRFSLAKLWATLGSLATVAVVVGGAYFYLFGLSQCGSCSCASPPPEPMTLDETVSGELTTFTTYRVYELSLMSPATVTITALGDFDTYLELYAAGAEDPALQDDDSGPGLNAMITTTLPEGTWYILVRPYAEETGHFTLSVQSLPNRASFPRAR